LESRPLIRLLGAILTGILTLSMVLGSMLLTQVDPMLMARRSTRVIQLPTTTLYPTLISSTPDTPQTPSVSRTPLLTPTPVLCIWPADWQPYIVQAGDTLALLASAARSSVYLLMQGNCLVNSGIQPGDVIYLPPLAFATPTQVVPRCGPPIWWILVVVQRGDTLYSLAQRHGTTVENIIWANCLQSDRIIAGQRIFLPPTVVVTPTFTPTRTGTPTLTPTPTPTVTGTPTVTATPTVTETPTDTPTPTVTPTEETVTPTPTITPTEETVTPTPTVTPTEETITPTPTPTVSGTPSPTPTETPILTPTSTPTLPPPTETPTPTSTSAPGR